MVGAILGASMSSGCAPMAMYGSGYLLQDTAEGQRDRETSERIANQNYLQQKQIARLNSPNTAEVMKYGSHMPLEKDRDSHVIVAGKSFVDSDNNSRISSDEIFGANNRFEVGPGNVYVFGVGGGSFGRVFLGHETVTRADITIKDADTGEVILSENNACPDIITYFGANTPRNYLVTFDFNNGYPDNVFKFSVVNSATASK